MRRTISYSGVSISASESHGANWSRSASANWSCSPSANWSRSSRSECSGSCISKERRSSSNWPFSCNSENSSLYDRIGANTLTKDKIVTSLKRELSQAVQMSKQYASSAIALAKELDELKLSTQDVKEEHEELLNDMQFVMQENEEMKQKVEDVVKTYRTLRGSFDKLQKEKEDLEIAFEKFKYERVTPKDGVDPKDPMCGEKLDAVAMSGFKHSLVVQTIKASKEIPEETNRKQVDADQSILQANCTFADEPKGSAESIDMLKTRIIELEQENERLLHLEKEKERLLHLEKEKERLLQLEKENERLLQLEKENERLLHLEKQNERLQKIEEENKRLHERVENNNRSGQIGHLALENVAELMDHARQQMDDKLEQVRLEKEELKEKCARAQTEGDELKNKLNDVIYKSTGKESQFIEEKNELEAKCAQAQTERNELEAKCAKAQTETHELKLILDDLINKTAVKDRQIAEMSGLVSELRMVGIDLMSKSEGCSCKAVSKPYGRGELKSVETVQRNSKANAGKGGGSHAGSIHKLMSPANWVLPNAFTPSRPPLIAMKRGGAA